MFPWQSPNANLNRPNSSKAQKRRELSLSRWVIVHFEIFVKDFRLLECTIFHFLGPNFYDLNRPNSSVGPKQL